MPITVVAPGCDWETTEATRAIVARPGTCYLRLDKSTAGWTGRSGEDFCIGEARVLREGSAMTIFATGGILNVALDAAAELAAEGIDCRVVSMHTVKPLDRAAVIDACQSTGGIVTVEEHTLEGGLGGAVAECCLDAGITPRRFHRIALRAGFSSVVGSQDYLRSRYSLDAASIREAVLRLLALNTEPALETVPER